jgi:hypothetical protein
MAMKVPRYLSSNPITDGLLHYENRVRAMCRGDDLPILLFGGPPGIGQTDIYSRVCREMGIKPHIIASSNYQTVVEELYWVRNEPMPCVDDKSSLTTSPRYTQIFMEACGPSRTVRQVTKSFPIPFKTKFHVIYLTNRRIDQTATNDLSALVSRGGGQQFWIGTNADDVDRNHVFDHTVRLVETGMLHNKRHYGKLISRENQNKALEWFKSNKLRLIYPNPRTMSQAAFFFQSNDPEAVEYQLQGLLKRT